VAAATAATAGVLGALRAQGSWVDQYARQSRIHGNSHLARAAAL
jgi:hypothetical protein